MFVPLSTPSPSDPQRSLTLAFCLTLLLCTVAGMIHLGAAPLSLIMVVALPLCALGSFRGWRATTVVVVVTALGAIGILVNVLLGIRGPGALSWLILAPVAAAIGHGRRSILLTFAVVLTCWAALVATTPGNAASSWAELRVHYLLVLCASVTIAWANSDRMRRWHGEALEIVHSFDKVIDEHPLPALVVIDDAIKMANERACRLLRRDRADLLGRSLEFVLPPELPFVGEIANFELEVEGQMHLLEARRSPVELPGGRGSILVLTDMTEVRQQESRRRSQEMRRQDAERLELVGQIAGGVAHDFNNLLATIMLNADLSEVAIDNGDPAMCRECQAEIRAASCVASDLVAQLLAYSGRGPVLREQVDVARKVASIVELLQGTAKTSDVRLSFTAQESFSVEADPSQISQILMNLATNAIEACEAGGTVEVTIDQVLLDRQGIEGLSVSPRFKSGRFLEIRVTDDGRGIPDGHLSRILEPYYTTRDSGSGLGLAAVKGILDGLGGALVVTSVPGAGSSFAAFIPLPETGSKDEPRACSRLKVLVVDDDPVVLSIVSIALEKNGYRTRSAETVTQARRILLQDPAIAVVIADYRLPDGCGLDLKPGQLSASRSVPLVLMSSYRVQDLSDLEGVRLLGKPFEFADLLAAIEAELDSARVGSVARRAGHKGTAELAN